MAPSRVLVLAFAAFLQTSLADVSGLRASHAASSAPAAVDAKLEETMRALDTNGNGKVDLSELTGFAKSQGLSTEEVLADFKELDVNNDGALDSVEIGPLFGVAHAAESYVEAVAKPIVAVEVAPKKPSPSAAAKVQKVVQNVDSSSPRNEGNGNTGFDLAALERDAKDQAGGVIASQLAERAQVLLARSAADETKAKAFDAAVRTLRGNATALSQEATKETREAARTATSAVSQKSLGALKKLQLSEQKAESDAEEHRRQAKQAMQRVRDAQATLRST